MTTSEQIVPPYPVLPTEFRAKRPTGLIISTVALTVALVAVGIFAVSQSSSLAQTRDDATAAEVRSDKALTAAGEENTDLTTDLSAARSEATVCAKAADLLARGANGYADLWNGMDDAADEFRILYAFYVRSIMRDTNVPNATLSAGWDALDACEAGGSSSSSGIDSL